MGTLGKVLLFVNLLAAGGLAYTVSVDWAARQAVQANALHHTLVLTGVPVAAPTDISAGADAVPLGVVTSGLYRVETVGPKFLADHFAGAGGDEVGTSGPVRTQLEELNAVKGKLDAKLGGSAAEVLQYLCGKADPAGKTPYVPGLLALTSETYAERLLVRGWAASAPTAVEANAAAARALFDRQFAAAQKIDPAAAAADKTLVEEKSAAVKKASDDSRQAFATYEAVLKQQGAEQGTIQKAVEDASAAAEKLAKAQTELQQVVANAGAGASRDEGDRKRRIGHLLVHVGQTEAWQKRVALVVGLRTYLTVVSDQATRLDRMAASADQQVTLDQAQFAEEYDTLRRLAVGRSILLRLQVAVRQDLESQRNKDDEAANQRRLLLAARRDDLAKVNAQVADALAGQAAVEARLYAVQRQVGDALQKNFALEAELAAAESRP